MAKVIDLTGNKYGRLTVISRATGKGKGSYWNCLCECGNYKVVSAQSLKTGGTKSCGCGKKDYYNRNNHGTQSPFYSTWGSMKARCNNPRHPAYKYYGGRGIKVCNEWNDFSAFRKWAEKTNTADSLTLERIDVNGDYCPENCTWASREAQANNRRSCRYYCYNGEIKDLTEWCNCLGLDYKNVHNRIYKLGWSFEKAITTPVFTEKRNKTKRRKRKCPSI